MEAQHRLARARLRQEAVHSAGIKRATTRAPVLNDFRTGRSFRLGVQQANGTEEVSSEYPWNCRRCSRPAEGRALVTDHAGRAAERCGAFGVVLAAKIGNPPQRFPAIVIFEYFANL